MKSIILAGVALLTVGCCCTNTEVVQYRRVMPVTKVVTRVVSPVIQPVIVDYVQPVDVTTTTIDFY
jgi:hypothetical protein